MSCQKKEIKIDALVYIKLQTIGAALKPGGVAVPPERVISFLVENYKPNVYLGGASVITDGGKKK